MHASSPQPARWRKLTERRLRANPRRPLPPPRRLYAEPFVGMGGVFILTLNDTPEVRCIFRRFAIEAVEFRYSVGAAKQRGREVLITPRGASFV